ncbi:MAG: LysE family translocator [Kiloniellales bacterium]|nr:LysE family translocator [Kiloniellales bacterium]
MSLESWIALLFALTVLGLTPGPAWAAVVTTSVARGLVPAAAMSLGVASADVFFLLLAAFGLVVLANALGSLFFAVKMAGAGYLIWLGIRLWRHPPALPEGPAAATRPLGPFLAGFALTLGNPKAIAFYLAFLPAFIDLPVMTGGDLALIAATTFAVIAGMLCGYAAIAARFGRLFRRETYRRRLGRVLGTTLIGTGAAVATR